MPVRASANLYDFLLNGTMPQYNWPMATMIFDAFYLQRVVAGLRSTNMKRVCRGARKP